MNMGIGNFLAEISSSESEEYQTRDPGYEPTQSVKDEMQHIWYQTGSKHLKKMKQLGQEDVCKNENDAKLSYEVAHR